MSQLKDKARQIATNIRDRQARGIVPFIAEDSSEIASTLEALLEVVESCEVGLGHLSEGRDSAHLWRKQVEFELGQARNTLTAQSRLLALAETLAGAVESFPGAVTNGTRMLKNAQAFTAAQAEYKDTGKVPCPECGEKDSEIERLKHGWKTATQQATTCARCLVFKHTPWKAHDGYICAECVGKENEDLRRQLAEKEVARQEAMKRLGDVCDDWDKLKADNAALVEALRQVNENLDTHTATGREAVNVIRAVLSQPHLGAGLLEELAALRKVVDAARVVSRFPTGSLRPLDRALDALDTIRNREGR